MTEPTATPLATFPTHAALIDRIFDEQRAWLRIERRLGMYPAIAKHFDLDMMRAAHGTPPFHVHYMAWRLGTWTNERNFEIFDALLAHAASLPGWERERHLLTGTDFGMYWGLLWQLQVAARLSKVGTDVCWPGGNAPDLRVRVDGKPLFVECYSFQKRYGVLEFITELCRWLGSDIELQRTLAIPLSFGKTASGDQQPIEDVLHELFRDLQQPGVLESARDRARVRQPVDLPMPAGTNHIWLVMTGPGEYRSPVGRHSSGEPEKYLNHVVSEVLRYKAGKNGLASHRPNVVVASFLLGADYQISRSLRPDYAPPADLPPDIDALGLGTTGVDIEAAELHHGHFRSGHRPTLDALGVPFANQVEGLQTAMPPQNSANA